MTKVTVEVRQDHLERIAQRSPLQAVTELIWNALDADANTVRVELLDNSMRGLGAVHVIDDGTGISHDVALNSFKSLGASWKRTRRTSLGGRILHGKAGEGRFAAYSIGVQARWVSRFRDKQTVKQLEIEGSADNLRVFEVSEPTTAKGRSTGTEVEITNIDKSPRSLLADDARLRLAKEFANYLRQYQRINIFFDGALVDASLVVDSFADYEVHGCRRDNGSLIEARLGIVEWKYPSRELCLCDRDGFTLATTLPGIHAPGFSFTAYLKSDYLRECHDSNLLVMEELQPGELARLIDEAKKIMRDHFRRRAAENAKTVVEVWKEEKTYPFEGAPQNAVEEVERQVFDVVALNVSEHLPDFSTCTTQSRRLSMRMLKAAIQSGPSELRRILQEVLDLPQQKLEELVELLDKTSLASIVSAAKLVVDRLDFLAGIETLLFDPDSKERLQERRELHRILAENTWLFGEQFHLTVDDKGLTEALHRHLELLGEEHDGLGPVRTADGTPGILDLMLSRRVPQASPDEIEHLVIELKRPKVKITEAVVNQLKEYAFAIAEDDRFAHTNTRWVFIAVSNEVGKDVLRTYFKQTDRPDGLVLSTENPHMCMWVRTWAQVIDGCRSRLQFVQQRLSYMADESSGLAYLKKTHEKYLQSVLNAPGSEPFRRLDPSEVKPFVNALPLYDLRVSAGEFSPEQVVTECCQKQPADVASVTWVQPNTKTKLEPGLFVAMVVGESMNNRAPDGSWCLFRVSPPNPEGRAVIVQHQSVADADLGGQYTLKVYEPVYDMLESGSRVLIRVALKPDSSNPDFAPLMIEESEEGAFRVIAELLEVLK